MEIGDLEFLSIHLFGVFNLINLLHIHSHSDSHDVENQKVDVLNRANAVFNLASHAAILLKIFPTSSKVTFLFL